MKQIKNNIRWLLSHEHVHFAASMVCGVAMGLLFASRLSSNEARSIPEPVRLPPVTVSSSSSVMREAAASEASSEASEQLVFFASYESSTAASDSRVPVFSVKKGRQLAAASSSSTAPQTPATVHIAAQLVLPQQTEAQPESSVSSAFSSEAVSSQESSSEHAYSSSIPSASSSSSVAPSAPSSSEAPAPASSSEQTQPDMGGFPAFGHAVQPFFKVPNWGAMSTPAEWKRTYTQMTDADWVPVPAYNLKTLTIPLKSLTGGSSVSPADIPTVTAKLYYSTRFMGKYDLDAGEYTGDHPGVDLKMPLGSPVGAIGGGRVYSVTTDARLGIHVIIEHRTSAGQFFSVYGHLGSAKVGTGDAVKPGQTIGFVGLTGMTTMAHLHLEVHAGVRVPEGLHGAAGDFDSSTVINPMTFIASGGTSR